ncbi:MAG: tyrosine-type recombinase/integrase [Clostridiales bacterium]|nr:tyrosine-type recombinase/integrase [Clostridiales bacterium]
MKRKRYLTNKLKRGEQFEDNDLVLCWDDGKCINPDTLSQKFRRLIERIGLKQIRLHDLHHTNATLMLEYGVYIKVAQQRLGHASISTTMDIYSHVTEKVEKEASDKLDKGIFEALDIGIG